jgi:hypothetical protein
MKKLISILFLLALSVTASGQVSSSTARRVRGGITPPATCKATAPADVFIDTDASVGSRLLVCTSSNTWTAQGGSGSTTPSSTETFTNKTFDTAGTGNSFSINSVAVTANTGTGAVARATSPTFVTPILGAATGTSLNVTGNITLGSLNLKYVGIGATTYTLGSADAFLLCTAGAGTTVTLPSAVGIEGRMYVVMRHAAGGSVVVQTTGAQVINSSGTSRTLGAINSAVTLISDGGGWYIISQVGTVS